MSVRVVRERAETERVAFGTGVLGDEESAFVHHHHLRASGGGGRQLGGKILLLVCGC